MLCPICLAVFLPNASMTLHYHCFVTECTAFCAPELPVLLSRDSKIARVIMIHLRHYQLCGANIRMFPRWQQNYAGFFYLGGGFSSQVFFCFCRSPGQRSGGRASLDLWIALTQSPIGERQLLILKNSPCKRMWSHTLQYPAWY